MEGVEIGNLQIPAIKGEKGDTGSAGTIQSISITMLPTTSSAYANNTGTTTNAIIELGIPVGVGISTATINASNELVLTLTNGTSLNLGVVVGKSITNVELDENYDFIVTFSDTSTTTVGNISTQIASQINTALASYYTKTEVDSEFENWTTDIKDNFGHSLSLSLNPSTYVMTISLLDYSGDTLDTKTVDLPLESVVVSGAYNNTTKKVVLTLQSGSTVEFSVADLVAGLQSEITNANKLSADLVDDTSTTHKFTTSANLTKLSGIESGAEVNIIERITLNGSSLTPSSKVVALTNIEISTNKVTSLSSSSTDTEYPSAKCVYDLIGDIESALQTLNTGGGVE